MKKAKQQNGRLQKRPQHASTTSSKNAEPPGSLPARLQRLMRSLSKPLNAAALIATIVGTGVVILAYQHQKHVDEREGKLDGQLVLSIGDNGPPLNQNAPTYFFFSMPKGQDDTRYAIPVHLKLANSSNVRDGQVNLVLTYDRKYARSLLPDELIRPSPVRPLEEQHFEKSANGAYDYAKYKLAFLSPHDAQSFDEGAIATSIPTDTQAPTLYSSGIGLDVTARTYSERDVPRDWEIRYRGLRVQDEAGLLDVMTHWYTNEIAFDIRRKAGFWRYIPKLIFQDDVVMYGYTPDFRLIPQQNLFVPTSMPAKAYGYRVKPYSWKLLFDLS